MKTDRRNLAFARQGGLVSTQLVKTNLVEFHSAEEILPDAKLIGDGSISALVAGCGTIVKRMICLLPSWTPIRTGMISLRRQLVAVLPPL